MYIMISVQYLQGAAPSINEWKTDVLSIILHILTAVRCTNAEATALDHTRRLPYYGEFQIHDLSASIQVTIF